MSQNYSQYYKVITHEWLFLEPLAPITAMIHNYGTYLTAFTVEETSSFLTTISLSVDSEISLTDTLWYVSDSPTLSGQYWAHMLCVCVECVCGVCVWSVCVCVCVECVCVCLWSVCMCVECV